MNKQTFFETVFAPQKDDRVLFLVDTPHHAIEDNDDWRERRAMAEEWREAFDLLPVRVHPLLTYAATGANNGDLPEFGQMAGQPVSLEAMLSQSTIAIAMTRYSATAPLSRWTRQMPDLRVASMPGVLRRMEQTALAADYRKVARQTHILSDLLTDAEGAETVFTTGDTLFFDLRYRTGHADDGLCHRGKAFPLINLPSGEAFIVPYEGERATIPSRTAGRIPMRVNGESFTLDVAANRIVNVIGDSPEARTFAAYLEGDPARRNIAELGLGCNDKAVVRGAVIEDEKAGMHWAYGRSEHLGGTVGPEAFTTPAHIVHQDIVYAPESEIGIARMTLQFAEGKSRDILLDNTYLDLNPGVNPGWE